MSDYIYEKNARIVINTAYKFIIVVELLIIILLSVYSLKLTGKINEVKPLPIFINKETGSAKAIDFDFIDAMGETRSNAEINDFITGFISDLYTYNRLTVKTNLVNAISKTSAEAAADIKNTLLLSKRYDHINRSMQGLVSVKSISILEKLPDLKIQVYFSKRLISSDGDSGSITEYFAILRIKPVIRKKGNAHGLLIVEYRENIFLNREERDDY